MASELRRYRALICVVASLAISGCERDPQTAQSNTASTTPTEGVQRGTEHLSGANTSSGRLDEGMAVLEAVSALPDGATLSDGVANLTQRYGRAIVLFRQERFDEASKEFGAVADGLIAEGDKLHAFYAVVWQARAYLEGGHAKLAERILADYVPRARDEGSGFRLITLAAMQIHCETLLEQRQWKDARASILELARSLDQGGDPGFQLEYYVKKGLARISHELGDRQALVSQMQDVVAWELRQGTNMRRALHNIALYGKAIISSQEGPPAPEPLLWLLAECDAVIFDEHDLGYPRKKECIMMRCLATFFLSGFLGSADARVQQTWATNLSLLEEAFGELALLKLKESVSTMQRKDDPDKVVQELVTLLNAIYEADRAGR